MVVDTNCFIQARDLKVLPWGDLFPSAKRVDIVVAPTVMDELDTLKSERSQRVRDRARLALDLIRQAGRTDGMRLVLKESEDLRVELSIGDIGRIDWDSHPNLDQARPDDRLVAEALTLGSDAPNVLLSHDTGPLIRGRRAGMDTRELPEGWLLPPQTDENAKELSRLKRENEELKRRAPVLEVNFLADGETTEEMIIERLLLPPLSGDTINRLVAATRKEIPMETGVFAPRLGFSIGGEPGFTQNDYNRYYADYSNFIGSLPQFFQELHDKIHWASATTAINYRIENVGTATAEGMTVDFSVAEEWLIFADEKHAQEFYGVTVAGPKLPLSPKLRKAEEVGRLVRSLPTGLPPAPRDPTGFYWETRPTGIAHRGVLRCEEFRAKRTRDDIIWLYPWNQDRDETTLILDVHSRTGSAPIVKTLSLRMKDVEVPWTDHRVLECTTGWISAVLAASIAD